MDFDFESFIIGIVTALVLTFCLSIAYAIGAESAESPKQDQRIEQVENSIESIEEYLQELTRTIKEE